MTTSHIIFKCLISTLFLGIHSSKIYVQSENTTAPVVTIPQGTLRGTTLTSRKNRTFSAFLGIPYAQPPIGDLRFANPIGANGWNGTLNVATDSIMCPQIEGGSVIGEEDCLYLNVYAPQTATSLLLPVMAYIYGGAFKSGNPNSTSYGPQYIMDEDVILVIPNYRLGPFGFLSTGDEVASGNWGLKDQVLALKWVQQNIEYFGGDPDRVTLFGESTGGACVHLLTLSDTTIGLFHRYIIQSGSASATTTHKPRAKYSQRAFEIGRYVGCSNATSISLISCLRTVNFSEIISLVLQYPKRWTAAAVGWGPTDEPDIEGAILTDSPYNLVAAGNIRDLPCIFGVVRDEGLLNTAIYYENEKSLRNFVENFDDLLPDMLDWAYLPDSGASWLNATKSFYLKNDSSMNTTILLKKLTTLCGDSRMFYPIYFGLKQQHAVAQNPQYFYSFNYRGTYTLTYEYAGNKKSHGVAHGDSLLYLFQRNSAAPDGKLTMSKTDNIIIDTMVQLWTSFAKNGTPTAWTPNGILKWEPYSTKDNYLQIGNETDTTIEMQYGFLPDRMHFWASLYGILETVNIPVEDLGTVISSPNYLLMFLTACAVTLVLSVLE